jgi:hypothetical protein
LHTAPLSHFYVGVGAHTSSHIQLEPGPGLGIGIPAKVTLGKGIIARPFRPHVKTDPQRHGPCLGQIVLEAGEQVTQRVLPASEQCMHVLVLGDAGTGERTLRQGVTVQYHHPLEIVRHCPRGG